MQMLIVIYVDQSLDCDRLEEETFDIGWSQKKTKTLPADETVESDLVWSHYTNTRMQAEPK